MAFFFGLISHLDDSKWSIKDGAPMDKRTNKKWLETYQVYGITSCHQEGDHMRLGLSSDSGTQRRGLLYHAKENPFKDVGHAWFTFDKGDVIVGMAVEEDWVLLSAAELAKITPPVEKKVEIKRAETVDLGIYGDLDHTKWNKHKEGPPHMGRAGKGYHMYSINGMKGDLKDGSLKVAVEQQGGDNHLATPAMHNVKVNPFKHMTKAFLKIVNDEIVGVMTESDEWVERK